MMAIGNQQAKTWEKNHNMILHMCWCSACRGHKNHKLVAALISAKNLATRINQGREKNKVIKIYVLDSSIKKLLLIFKNKKYYIC